MTHFWERCWKERVGLQFRQRQKLVRCEAEWCWETSRFTDFDLWIALEGSGEMDIDDVRYPVTAGFTVCFPPGDRKVCARHDPKQPLQVFYGHFALETPDRIRLPGVPPPEPVHLNTDSLLWGTVRELADSSDASSSSVFQENLFWQLLLRCERMESVHDSSPEERLRALIREIRESPAMPRNIDQLARRAFMSTGHFRRVFRHLTGKSPIAFILDCRIDRAAYYLKETRLPIQRVAATVGYADIYFFSRQFKERTGRSPSAYRRLN